MHTASCATHFSAHIFGTSIPFLSISIKHSGTWCTRRTARGARTSRRRSGRWASPRRSPSWVSRWSTRGLDAHGKQPEEHVPDGAEEADGPAQKDQNQDPQEAPEQTGTAALAAAHVPNCGCCDGARNSSWILISD